MSLRIAFYSIGCELRQTMNDREGESEKTNYVTMFNPNKLKTETLSSFSLKEKKKCDFIFSAPSLVDFRLRLGGIFE